MKEFVYNYKIYVVLLIKECLYKYTQNTKQGILNIYILQKAIMEKDLDLTKPCLSFLSVRLIFSAVSCLSDTDEGGKGGVHI